MGLDSFMENEPKPLPSTSPAIYDLVYQDLQLRDENGAKKYGTRLQANNGRDPLIDLYQELMDALVYTRQALFEKYGK